MDPLSDLLRVVRLDGAYFYPVEAAEPWAVSSAPARELSPRVLPGSEHLISYHILLSGRCFGGLIGEERVELAPGDAIVFPHGDAHVMSSGCGALPGPDFRAEAPHRIPEAVLLGEGASRPTSFICGYLGCDLRPFNPLLAALPRRMHMRGLSATWLGGFTRQLTEESRLGRAGADTVITRLAELMFIEALRRYLEELPPGQTGWLAGLRDPFVGRALSLMHGEPARNWTIEDLARQVGLSRSVFAERFTELIGIPSMQYLARWRMQVASGLLGNGAAVATAAAEVGYDSEAAFSRAFKKLVGVPPSVWRDRLRADA